MFPYFSCLKVSCSASFKFYFANELIIKVTSYTYNVITERCDDDHPETSCDRTCHWNSSTATPILRTSEFYELYTGCSQQFPGWRCQNSWEDITFPVLLVVILDLNWDGMRRKKVLLDYYMFYNKNVICRALFQALQLLFFGTDAISASQLRKISYQTWSL